MSCKVCVWDLSIAINIPSWLKWCLWMISVCLNRWITAAFLTLLKRFLSHFLSVVQRSHDQMLSDVFFSFQRCQICLSHANEWVPSVNADCCCPCAFLIFRWKQGILHSFSLWWACLDESVFVNAVPTDRFGSNSQIKSFLSLVQPYGHFQLFYFFILPVLMPTA